MNVGAERMEPEVEAWLAPGGRFQGYDIESILGVGGFSVVYRVRHHFLGRVQAMKVLKLQHTQDKELRELALREALALARIQHTNLVSVTDAGLTDDGIVWMVMPLLEGCTLRDYMVRADLPLLEALRVAVETCDGVFSAHEHGIVHRDVKPENVFITKTYQVVVLDLGMAKFVDFGMSTTGKRRPVGTVRYMSPEQLLSERVDVRTDVYAIGMMLYEMIARHPFEVAEDGVTRLDKMQMGMAHIHREPPALRSLAPSCPEAIAAIVHRAIAKDREQRFVSVQALAGAIRAEGQRYERELRARPGGLAEIPPLREPGSRREYFSAQPLDTNAAPHLPSQRVVVGVATAATPKPSIAQPTEPLPAAFRRGFQTEPLSRPDPADSAIVPVSRRALGPRAAAFATTEPASSPRAPGVTERGTLEMAGAPPAARPAQQHETERFSQRRPARPARWASYALGSMAMGIGAALLVLWLVGPRGREAPAALDGPRGEASSGVTAAPVAEAPLPAAAASAEAAPSASASAPPAPSAPPATVPKKPAPSPPARATSTSTLPAVPTADWTKLPPEEQPRF